MVATRPAPKQASGNGKVPTNAPRKRRNWRRIGVGAILVAGCGVGGLLTTLSAGNRTAVLVIVRPVAAGEAIERADLREVSISLHPTLHAIRAENLSEVAGKPAAVNLVPGLLSEKHVGAGPAVADGEAVVGLLLKPGQMPEGLAVGSPVRIVRFEDSFDPEAGRGGGRTLVERARVKEIGDSDGVEGGRKVSVIVPEAASASVTSAAAVGRVGLALLSGA